MEYFNYLVISMIVNIILLFCLLQPNIVRFLHSHHLDWKNKSTDYIGREKLNPDLRGIFDQIDDNLSKKK